MNWIKSQFTKQNLMLCLLIGLGAHNYYLQTLVKESISASYDASYEAEKAKDYASEAADYASDAARNSSDASDYAHNAYINSFGNQCWGCPD